MNAFLKILPCFCLYFYEKISYKITDTYVRTVHIQRKRSTSEVFNSRATVPVPLQNILPGKGNRAIVQIEVPGTGTVRYGTVRYGTVQAYFILF